MMIRRKISVYPDLYTPLTVLTFSNNDMDVISVATAQKLKNTILKQRKKLCRHDKSRNFKIYF